MTWRPRFSQAILGYLAGWLALTWYAVSQFTPANQWGLWFWGDIAYTIIIGVLLITGLLRGVIRL